MEFPKINGIITLYVIKAVKEISWRMGDVAPRSLPEVVFVFTEIERSLDSALTVLIHH